MYFVGLDLVKTCIINNFQIAVLIILQYPLIILYFCYRYVDSNFLFKQKAFDYSVARFLKESPLHMSKFENSLSDFASSVKVWIRNDKGDGEKLIEYQCRPLPVSKVFSFSYRPYDVAVGDIAIGA